MFAVHYVGTLLDGTKFDSSRDRGEPFSFKLGTGNGEGLTQGLLTPSHHLTTSAAFLTECSLRLAHQLCNLPDALACPACRVHDSHAVVRHAAVIKGWDKGVATMKKGETAVLKCAPEYAYGEAGSPPKIPPSSTLSFEASCCARFAQIRHICKTAAFF